MSVILHIKTSCNLQGSVTRELGAKTLARLLELHPGAAVTAHDFAVDPVPHLTPELLGAMFTGAPAEALALSDRLSDELLACDVLLLEAPMYNFTVPSTLKAWIDHVCRAKKTFRYTAEGVEGLVTGKKAVIVIASGGVYTSGPWQAAEHVESYLRAILGFLGVTDVQVIRAEGVAMGQDAAKQAKEKAEEAIRALAL